MIYQPKLIRITSLLAIFIVAHSIPLTNAANSISDAFRMVGLNAHNNFRSTVALGNAVNGDGKLPKATNMYKMTWSKTVEGYAIIHAKSCNFSHR
jgi:hypothetical protein